MSLNSLNGSGISPHTFSDVANFAKDSVAVIADQLGGQSSPVSSNSNPSLGASSDSLSAPGLGSDGNKGTIQSDLSDIMNALQNLSSDVDGDNAGQNGGHGNGQSSTLEGLQQQVGNIGLIFSVKP